LEERGGREGEREKEESDGRRRQGMGKREG